MAEKSHIKVLLVDDEETLLEYMSKRLVRDGFTVKTSLSGEEGLEAVTGEQFDVAVVDLKMPGMDGVETQRALSRRSNRFSSVFCSHRSWFSGYGP